MIHKPVCWPVIAGVFAPTMFSKAYGNLICEGCSSTGTNASTNTSGPYVCHNCHYDLVSLFCLLHHFNLMSHVLRVYRY